MTRPAFPGGSGGPFGFLSFTSGENGSRLPATASGFAAGCAAFPAVAAAWGAAFFLCTLFFAGAGLCSGFGFEVCPQATGRRQHDIARIPTNFAVVFTSVIVFAYRFAGAAVGVVAAAGASAAFVKNVVMVNIPVTEAPGFSRKLAAEVALAMPSSFKSPTFMIRESRPSLEKKSNTEKYGPSACTSNGSSK